MKENMKRTVLILALAVFMIGSLSMSVSAKSKKTKTPGKPSMYVEVYYSDVLDESNYVNVDLYSKGKNAKSVELYRATSKNGTYKKIKTLKKSQTYKVKGVSGVSYYKARSVNGDKKSKFTKPQAVYSPRIVPVGVGVNTINNTLEIGMLVNNASSKKPLEIKYDEDEYAYFSYGYGTESDEEFSNYKGLLDENRVSVKSVTIKPETTGCYYLVYSLEDEYDLENALLAEQAFRSIAQKGSDCAYIDLHTSFRVIIGENSRKEFSLDIFANNDDGFYCNCTDADYSYGM